MQITRKQIIDYLHANHYATAKELSIRLNVTPANIRHHLGELKNQGVIEDFGKIPTKGRGRPTRIHRLADDSLTNNLPSLTNSLFKMLKEIESPLGISEIFNRLAHLLLDNVDLDLSLFQRLNQATKWLNENHYASRWEASPTGPRVILGFCPYIAILESNPEICLLDNALISNLLELPVIQTEKLERHPSGSRHCIFHTKR